MYDYTTVSFLNKYLRLKETLVPANLIELNRSVKAAASLESVRVSFCRLDSGHEIDAKYGG